MLASRPAVGNIDGLSQTAPFEPRANSCECLAASLDGFAYNPLRRRKSWDAPQMRIRDGHQKKEAASAPEVGGTTSKSSTTQTFERVLLSFAAHSGLAAHRSTASVYGTSRSRLTLSCVRISWKPS